MKILVVDDERNIAQGIRAMLLANTLFEASVRCACSAAEALATARQFRPDLLITDIRMPVTNGLQLIDQMKAEELCRAFVVLSGYEDFSYAREALRKGAADYLTKPVEKEYLYALCERIQAALRLREQREEGTPLPEEGAELLSWKPEEEIWPASLRNIVSYIERNYRNPELSGKTISEALFFHPSYISQLIGKYTDQNLNGIISYFRLKKAMELLLSPRNYRIGEIGEMVGFGGERQFYKVFKKYVDMTPAAFRSRYGRDLLKKDENEKGENQDDALV